MLDSKKSKSYNENKVVTIIGPGTLVSGEIASRGTIRIEGQVSGQIRSEDSIVVQESGKIKADLIAGQIIISGEVRGNIFAQDRLEITATGKVIGDITAPRISIAEGVLFEGKCTMKPPEKTPSVSAPKEEDGAKQDANAKQDKAGK
jgi:cytoskeletal protein CcmA (bactofilin family)